MLNQIKVEDCLTFPVKLRWFRVLVLRSSATKGWHMESIWITGKRFFGKQFSTLDSFSRFSSKKFIWRRAKKLTSSLWRSEGKNKSDKWRRTKLWHNSNADVCDKTFDYEFFKKLVDIPQNYVVGQQRQQISELQFDRFPDPSSFLVWGNKIQNTGLKWFWFFVGSHVMDRRSGDGRFGGWFKNHCDQFTVMLISWILRCWTREFASSLTKIT